MLKRYYIDVSSLNANDIAKLQNQIRRFDFETFQHLSNDGLYVIGLDVFLNPEQNIYEIADLPPQCNVREM